MQTWPITNLEKIRDEDIEQAEIRTDNGERHLLMIDRRQVEYYLRPREIFARCYAQFVARLTDHNVLTKELKHQLRPGYADIFSLQWNEDEFAPIASAIVATFKQKGWM